VGQASDGHPDGLEFGEIWTQAAGAGHAGEGRWRMGGLGFGLPLSRLYARYFGALPLSRLYARYFGALLSIIMADVIFTSGGCLCYSLRDARFQSSGFEAWFGMDVMSAPPPNPSFFSPPFLSLSFFPPPSGQADMPRFAQKCAQEGGEREGGGVRREGMRNDFER
jgi:hypothetical protein